MQSNTYQKPAPKVLRSHAMLLPGEIMPTAKRSEQARINGAKSKGPKTRLGKFIAASNSRKTGIHAAKSAALKLENSSDYDGQLAAYVRRFQPQDTVELNYVRELCCVDWQIHRFKAYLVAVLNHQLDIQDTTLQATDIDASDDLKGALALASMNKSSNVVQLLTLQERRLTTQRLSILRCLRETRAISPVLYPGFYLNEAEELNPISSPKNEPKPFSINKEAA